MTRLDTSFGFFGVFVLFCSTHDASYINAKDPPAPPSPNSHATTQPRAMVLDDADDDNMVCTYYAA